jgi:hypothetical protein
MYATFLSRYRQGVLPNISRINGFRILNRNMAEGLITDTLNGKITLFTCDSRSRGGSVGIALGYGLDDRGFESQQGMGIFLFTTASRPALGPTQPPIQWVPGAISLGIKLQRREADHCPPSSA